MAASVEGGAMAPRTDVMNRRPEDYAPFLRQFREKKLRAMHDSFLGGDGLAPYLSAKELRRAASAAAAVDQLLLSLTTAVCWSLVAPEAAGAESLAAVDPPLNAVKPPLGAAAENLHEGALGGAVRAPPGPLDSVVQAECQDLVGWAKEWKGSSAHQEAIRAAVSAPAEELVGNKAGVEIAGNADFGLKRVGWSTIDVPAVPFPREAPRYFRTLTVLNLSSSLVTLLDVCGVPSIDETFQHHDDFGLAHHYDFDRDREPANVASSSVIMQPGAQYQVTLELRCSEEDIAFHQQWLLFIFASGNGLKFENPETFVIGRRVSALIGRNVKDVQECLSTEAKPFYPAALRRLFDCDPRSYEVTNEWVNSSGHNWRVKMPACGQTYVLSIWPQQLEHLEKILYGKSSPSESSEEGGLCECYLQQLRQLSRLLALEEAAMERDIKEYDLFNVRLAHLESSTFILEVPGLPENRPSVFAEDFVYIRSERDPQVECAAEVVAVEFQPKPRLILKLPLGFVTSYSSLSQYAPSILVHVRFTFDRLVLSRMHIALVRVAKSSVKLLPCVCRKGNRSEWVGQPATPKETRARRFPSGSSGLDIPEMINKCLNIEQWTAVENVVDRFHGPGPYVILGPPGTGKTITCVECVLQLLARDPEAKLCVCAPSNYAADILCSGIAAGGIDSASMWRMNDPRRTMASIKVDVLPYGSYRLDIMSNPPLTLQICFWNKFWRFCNFRFLSKTSVAKLSFKVIVCTCGAAGMLTEKPLVSRAVPFTHILIDEAGQALIPESFIPLSLGDSNTAYILCGDPKQLGPVVHSRSAAENGLDDTLIGRFQAAEEVKFRSGRGSTSIVTKLVHNYRANQKLLELPSRLFYNNELIASAPASMVAPPTDWDELKGRDFPMLFYGVKGQQMREGESPSYFNPVEAGKVADLITGLVAKSQIGKGDIGVMAPYRRQVQKLRLVLRSRGLGAVRVGTVDDYQGQEERVVFISTVLTRPESLKHVKSSEKGRDIGFLSNAKRFNVAITRAKAMLVVVGHPLVLSLDENWSELMQFCLGRDAFRGYGSEYVVPGANDRDDDGAEEDDEVQARKESAEIAKAIEKMAELSLLGMGDVDKMFPGDLDSMYNALSEETEWRIQR